MLEPVSFMRIATKMCVVTRDQLSVPKDDGAPEWRKNKRKEKKRRKRKTQVRYLETRRLRRPYKFVREVSPTPVCDPSGDSDVRDMDVPVQCSIYRIMFNNARSKHEHEVTRQGNTATTVTRQGS